MKTNDVNLKKMDVKTLGEEVDSLRRELLNLRLNTSSAQVHNSSQVKKIRTRIARALTYITQKESSLKKV
jgi:ribosomal protein L29